MTPHGGELRRLGHGSVVQEIIKRADIPVLLVPPTEMNCGIIPETVIDSILIPLDGSALAEQVLEPALELAQLMEARCSLVRIADARSCTADRIAEEVHAEAYLERIAGKIRGQGVQARTRIVVAQHVAEAILNEAATQSNNLIALATHGRSGLKRPLLGSVADKLIRSAASPAFVCRPTREQHQDISGLRQCAANRCDS
jgi:nucleotide-binding universal stress UspA family protein